MTLKSWYTSLLWQVVNTSTNQNTWTPQFNSGNRASRTQSVWQICSKEDTVGAKGVFKLTFTWRMWYSSPPGAMWLGKKCFCSFFVFLLLLWWYRRSNYDVRKLKLLVVMQNGARPHITQCCFKKEENTLNLFIGPGLGYVFDLHQASPECSWKLL